MPEAQKLPDLSSLTMKQNSQLVARVDKQAETIHQFSLIAERIQPCLTIDGGNFNAWSRNMTDTWDNFFMGDTEYFTSIECNNDYQRILIAMSFLHHRIERSFFNQSLPDYGFPTLEQHINH
ncbi:hypothetical protein O181_057606 [Austropuccinia psidii MF-1]|uniref:Uncharacterized protein n=1 Tax=Austropuccinia psidii MF-1 TaxID=1389203 RepID=A0A9Q3E8M9_9BASI|nr:hypothetical protein [Austropuccinia psidii MF-1]